MAPRSARKRKSVEGEAVAAPTRRKKREDTPAKAALAGASEGANESQQTPTEREEQENTYDQGDLSLSFEPEEMQLIVTMDESPTGEDLFPILLETQYEEDEEEETKDGEHIDEPVVEEEEQGTQHEFQEGEGEMYGAAEESMLNGEAFSANVDEQDGEPHGAEQDEERDSLDCASASIEEILKQLAEVAANFMSNYRELTSEGEAIQEELDQLNAAQESRCEKLLSRLQRAGNSIFSFSQDQGNEEGEVSQVAPELAG